MSPQPELIRWDAPRPYEVAFSTRLGGVSEGRFASLNLGILTGDEPDRVIENRRLLCQAAGLEPERATMVWQQHGARVVAAEEDRGVLTGGFEHPPADGLVTEQRGLGLLVLTADCLPVAIVRTGGERPALALLHVGRSGLLAGIVGSGIEALGDGRGLAAVIGPGIGPCCYEVGEEIAEPYRARYGPEVVRGRKLDLWRATELELHATGCAAVERTDICTACDPGRFFSHRRDGATTGRQGAVAAVG